MYRLFVPTYKLKMTSIEIEAVESEDPALVCSEACISSDVKFL